MTYLVSYDLNAPCQDYVPLIDAIKTYKNVFHVLKSQWLICSGKSAQQIFDHLSRYVDKDDCLLICELTQNYACDLTSDAIKWLKTFHYPNSLLNGLFR